MWRLWDYAVGHKCAQHSNEGVCLCNWGHVKVTGDYIFICVLMGMKCFKTFIPKANNIFSQPGDSSGR